MLPLLVSILGEGRALHELADSMAQMLVGFALACLIGMPLGTLMGRVRFIDALVHPWVSMLVVTSVAALVPIAAATGVAPQNLNFAVRGEVAQIFLSARGIKVHAAAHAHPLSTEALAAAGLKSTVFIQCQND